MASKANNDQVQHDVHAYGQNQNDTPTSQNYAQHIQNNYLENLFKLIFYAQAYR